MKRVLFIFACLSGTLWAQLPAQITLQGGVWPGSPAPTTWTIGTPGTFGFPVPDSAAITCASTCAVASKPNNIGVFTTSDGSSGHVASQFYVEGMWPSGHVAWLKIDVESQGSITSTVPDTTMYLVKKSSTSDFPVASPLAVDNGTTITVSTGTATYIIRKANFDIFHDVLIGATHLVASGSHGTNDGLILLGPATPASAPVGACSSATAGAQPGGTPFIAGGESACGTTYLSNLDAASTCLIEENGPVRATLKCTGSFAKSAASCTDNGTASTANCYMHWTVREFFYLNKNHARVAVTLRNADFPLAWPSVSGTDFNAAYKQYATLTAQVTMSLAAGSRSITIANHTGTPATTTLTGGSGDNAYLYQGYSDLYLWSDFNSSNCSSLGDSCVVSPIHRTGTPGTYGQDGYQINSNQTITGTAVGTHAQHPAGWADESDTSNMGVEIGIDQLSALWPKSLEFRSGGNVVQVGIDPLQSEWVGGGDQAYVSQAYGYKTSDLFFNFHTTSPTSLSDSFLRFQNHLLGRAARAYYNSANEVGGGAINALINPLVDPYYEDNYYLGVGMPNTCIPSSTLPGQCMRDAAATAGNVEGFNMFRFYTWSNSGTNQQDFGLTDTRAWLQRGCALDGSGNCTVVPGILGSVPGRYMRAGYFYYYFLSDFDMPHSDWSGGWRCHTTNAGSPVNGNSCASLSTAPCPTGSTACSNLTAWGWQSVASTNGGQRDYPDNANSGAHQHIYGAFEYYLTSGEEHIKDQLMQAYKDGYLNTQVIFNNATLSNGGGHTPNSCGVQSARAIGHWLKGHARVSMFLRFINDPEQDTPSTAISLSGADNTYEYCIAPDASIPGAGEGETPPGSCPTPYTAGACTSGVARDRGQIIDVGVSSTTQYPPWPQSNPLARTSSTLFTNMEVSGLYDYHLAATDLRGLNWYITAPTTDLSSVQQYAGDLPILDSMYLISRWTVSDPFTSVGTSSAQTDWPNSGWISNTIPDHLNDIDSSSSCTDHVTCSTCSLWGDCGHNCANVSTPSHGVQQPCIETDHWANFVGIGATTNTLNGLGGNTWQKQYDMYQLRMDSGGRIASEWGVDYMQIPLQFIFNHNPPSSGSPQAANNYALSTSALSLQSTALTVTGCTGTGCTFTSSTCKAGSGAGTCTLTWTPPAGRGVVNGISNRLKYSSCDNTSGACTPRFIAPWLGFHNNLLIATSGGLCTYDIPDATGCYELNPTTNINWGASTNVPDPVGLNSSAVGNSASSYTFNTAVHQTYIFYLATFQSASPPPPTVFITTTTR